MNRIEKKSYIKISVLIIVVVALLFVEVSYLPEKIKAISLEIIDKKQEIRDLDIQIGKLEDIKKEFKEIEDNNNNIEKYVVNYSDMYDFTVSIEDIVKKSSVEYDSRVLSKEDTFLIEDSLLYLDYDINVSGDFNKTMEFLSYLESLEYYNNIEKITVRSKSKTGKYELDEVSLNFVLRVYAWDDRKK